MSGGWLITRHDTGSPGGIRSVITFADGGVFSGLDLKPTAPPYLGSWEARENRRFVAVFWTPLTDDQGASIGTARIRAIGRVDDDKISGTYTATLFVQGQEQRVSGRFHGDRIDAD